MGHPFSWSLKRGTGVRFLHEASRCGCGDDRLVLLWSVCAARWWRIARRLLGIASRLFSSSRRIFRSQRSSLSQRILRARQWISARATEIRGTRPIRARAVVVSGWRPTPRWLAAHAFWFHPGYALEFHAPRAVPLAERVGQWESWGSWEPWPQRISLSSQSCCHRERGLALGMGIPVWIWLGISIPLAKHV
jgi:hypothetical protein